MIICQCYVYKVHMASSLANSWLQDSIWSVFRALSLKSTEMGIDDSGESEFKNCGQNNELKDAIKCL